MSVKAAQEDLMLLQRFLRGECNESELLRARQVVGRMEAQGELAPLLDDLWEEEPLVLPAADLLYQRIIQALPPAAVPPAALPAAPNPIATPKSVLPWRRPTARKIWGMTAGVCLVLMATFWAVQSRRHAPKTLAGVTWLTVMTNAGQRKTIWLPDSSRVVLNARSQLKYPVRFMVSRRNVELVGEAFFQIIPDKTRPFTVETRKLTATVLGTSFNVMARPGQASAEVAVVTGRVAVAGIGQPQAAALILGAHEAARYPTAAGGLARVAFPDESLLAWKTDELVFHDAAILEVAAQLQAFYDVSIQIAGEDLPVKRYTGRFRYERLENVLESLRYTLDFDFVISGKQVVIRFK